MTTVYRTSCAYRYRHPCLSRNTAHSVHIATGILASREIPHILCIFATGIHASRKIPHFLCIKKATWGSGGFFGCGSTGSADYLIR